MSKKQEFVEVHFLIPFDVKDRFEIVQMRIDKEFTEKREELLKQLSERYGIKLVWSN